MPFRPEKAKERKKGSVYKTLYISEELMEEVNRLAIANDTSFNKMVITMIEYCLQEIEEKK